MNAEELIRGLHPLERKVLPLLKKHNSYDELVKAAGILDIEVMRALQWLSNKEIVKLKKETTEQIILDANGREYVEKGLPEKRFLNSIKEKEKSLDELKNNSGLNDNEMQICIGTLKNKGLINVKNKDGRLLFSITDAGKEYTEKESLEEKFLYHLPLDKDKLLPEQQYAFDSLIKRRSIIKVKLITDTQAELTELGRQILEKDIAAEEYLDRLTPEIISSGKWKKKEFRSYDIKINVPKIHGGRRQPYAEFLDKARQKMVELGFVEMTGPIIELEFYNYDALFQPQNHPARTWSSSYRIIEPKQGKLPDKKIVAAVKAAHENGGKTGSKGWQYKWDPKIAMQLMARAHDTAISPRYLPKVPVPGKYFSLVKCFRPDVIDATHGVEFTQLGGFVVGKELSFRHLLGLLKEFAEEMTGAKEFRFSPDYFPFTEPSVELSAKHPEFGWIELCGAGIFRPELTIPLGVNEPVIAWGFGIDRLAMLKLGIKDIRTLFSHDLGYLRASKKVM